MWRKRQARIPSGTMSLIAKLQLRLPSAGAQSRTCEGPEVQRKCLDCLGLSVGTERRVHR
jgi:hypothetical protein